MINNRQISNNNIPFLILRWNKTEHLLIDLHKWNFHLHYEFLLRLRVHNINFDFSPEAIAKESGDPNKCFLELILENRENLHEISIFTDGSRSNSEDEGFDVGCVVVIPNL